MHKEEPIRLSKWIFLFQKQGCNDIALYHSLNIDVVFIEIKFKRMIELLKHGTTLKFIIQQCSYLKKDTLVNTVEELVFMEFIVNTDVDDMKLLKKMQNHHLLPVGMETLYLMLTDQCNLRCSYCFINNNMPVDYVCNKMTWEVAKKAIDMYFLSLSKNTAEFDQATKIIFFYGGEPFLNFELIKKSIGYVEECYSDEIGKMGDRFRFSTITNGTLITQEIAKFLSDHKNFSVGISIDGDEITHNQKRKYLSEKGSFKDAIRGYSILKNMGCEVSISCTVADHNIDKLDSLIKLSEKYKFMAVNMNLLLDTEKSKVSYRYMIEVSKKLTEYFELARERGIYEDRIMRKLKAFISHKIHPFDCQATGNQIVCSPDGKLGLCHEGIGSKNFFFASISESFDFHGNALVQEWNKRSPLNMPQCFDCSAIGICGGGCAYGAWLRNGSVWSVDDRFCVHSLTTLEWLIWDLYKTF